MPKGAGSSAPKKERFVSTKKMINDEEGMGRIFKYGGMFIVLIGWNVLESFTRFIPSAIWVFIISGLLDALVNCLVIIFSAKLKGKNAWIWAAIISGWNVLSLFSHMLPINLWILIDIILDPILNILFLIFAPMILFDKSAQPVSSAPSPEKPAEKPAAAASKPDTPGSRPTGPASRPETIAETKDTPNSVTGSKPITDSVSENPLERDALNVIADLTHTNRILAEKVAKNDGGDKDAGLSGGNDG